MVATTITTSFEGCAEPHFLRTHIVTRICRPTRPAIDIRREKLGREGIIGRPFAHPKQHPASVPQFGGETDCFPSLAQWIVRRRNGTCARHMAAMPPVRVEENELA